jgi:Co/Zn/Cd efflux system component
VSGRRCKPRLSNNAKVLLLACCLFSCITVSQYIAALMAHSLALAADCASMLADALSFLGNLLAECAPPRRKVFLELIMSAVSLLLLGGFTLFFVLRALDNLDNDGSAGERAEVNAHIVIAFALLGLLFDVTSLVAFKVWHLDDVHEHPEPAILGGLGSPRTFSGDAVVAAAAMSSETDHVLGDESGSDGEQHNQRRAGASCGTERDWEGMVTQGSSAGAARVCSVRAAPEAGEAGCAEPFAAAELGDETHAGPKTNVNMLSAGLHLVSDFARSLTTLVEGAVLLGGYGRSAGVSSAFIDGVAALVVCTLIAAGFLAGCVRWVLEVVKRCRRRRAAHGTARAGSRQNSAAAAMAPALVPVKRRLTSRGLRASSPVVRHVRLQEDEEGSDGGGAECVGERGGGCGATGGTGGAANGDMAAADDGVDIEGGASPYGAVPSRASQCLGVLHSALQRNSARQRSSDARSSGTLTPGGRRIAAPPQAGSPSRRAQESRDSSGAGSRAHSSRSGFRSLRRDDSDLAVDGLPLVRD